jgi:hypothetical protein
MSGPRVTPRGYVDGVLGADVLGWCCRPGDYDVRLAVEIFVDGATVASGTADLPRADVARAGYGDGRFGFRIPLPRACADGAAHTLDVQTGGISLPAGPSFTEAGRRGDPESPWATTTFALTMSAPPPPPPAPVAEAPAAVAADAPPAPAAPAAPEPLAVPAPPPEPAPPPAPELRGYVDGIVDETIVGWVLDEARPEAAVPLEAFLDGVFIGGADADVPRADVARAGYGERHGFRFALPTPLEPGEYSIEVRTAPEGWRVPLVQDYSVYDADRRPLPGVNLREPRISGQRLSREALLGLDGWMYEWPGARVFDIICGRQSVPRPVFERQQARIRERRELSRAAGATLVEAVVPSKPAVYGEHLPAGVIVDDAGRPGMELSAALFDDNGVEVIDLAVALRQGKRHGLVFSRTGRDLTWLGGFTAYRVLAKEVAKRHPEIEPLGRDVLTLGELEPLPDSLAELPRLVWIGARVVPAGPGAHDEEREGRGRLRRGHLSAEYAVVEPALAAAAGSSVSLLRSRNPSRDASALVIHDGAAATLLPFLAEHYAQTLVAGGDAHLDQLLDGFTPEAVFEIVAERSLLLV